MADSCNHQTSSCRLQPPVQNLKSCVFASIIPWSHLLIHYVAISISLYVLSQAHQCTQRPICKQLAAVFQQECILGVWGMSWGVRSVRGNFSMSHLLRITLRFPLSLTKGKRLLFNDHVASQSRQLSRCHSYPPSRSTQSPWGSTDRNGAQVHPNPKFRCYTVNSRVQMGTALQGSVLTIWAGNWLQINRFQ